MLIGRVIIPEVFILGEPVETDIGYQEEVDPHSGVISKYNSTKFSVTFKNDPAVLDKALNFKPVDEAIITDYRGNSIGPGRIEIKYRGVHCTGVEENGDLVKVNFQSKESYYYIKPF